MIKTTEKTMSGEDIQTCVNAVLNAYNEGTIDQGCRYNSLLDLFGKTAENDRWMWDNNNWLQYIH